MSRIREIETINNGHICLDNTTTAPLGVGGVFTGPYQDTINFNTITIGIVADQDSATDGLVVRWSADGVSVTQTDEFSILANKGKVFTFSPANQYISVEYTNGAVAQGLLNIQTIFKKGGFKASSHRIQDSVVGDDDAELIKAVLTGEDENGVFQNVETTVDGVLKVSDESSGLSIAQGNVSGTTFIHKFGLAPLFSPGAGFSDIWDGSNSAGIGVYSYTYSTTNAIDSISSSDNADTQDIEISGLYEDGAGDWLEITQTVTATGQTRVAIPQALIRVFRMRNVGSVDMAGQLYCYENTAIVAGVPANTALIRAIINNGNNQTLMALYTIPSGKTGYMRDWYASAAGAKKTSVHIIHLDARPPGEVFQLKHVSSLIAVGTSNIQHKYEEPEIFLEKTDIVMHANTDEADAAISSGFDIVLVDN